MTDIQKILIIVETITNGFEAFFYGFKQMKSILKEIKLKKLITNNCLFEINTKTVVV